MTRGARTVAALLLCVGVATMVHAVQRQKVIALEKELGRARTALDKLRAVHNGDDPLSLYELQLRPLGGSTSKAPSATETFEAIDRGESPWFERNVTLAPPDKNARRKKKHTEARDR